MSKTKIMLSVLSRRKKELALDFLFCTAGSLILAASIAVFTAPNKMAPGGLTGIATLLYYTLGFPIGVTTLVLNLPLFALGFRHIGKEFLVKSVYCTIVSSLGVDLFEFLPKYRGEGENMLLAALYGGVIMGVGLGLVFLRNSTTGGTDIASRLLKLKWPYVSMGRMMLVIDGAIIAVSIVVFKSVNSGLYSIIALFVSARVVDAILYGADTGKMALIITDHDEEVARDISQELERGITILSGRGYYTGRERNVLMCAVRRQQTAQLRHIVRGIDPSAFIILCEAGDVIGEGFKPITKEN